MTAALESAINLLATAERYFEASEAKDGNAFYRGLSEQAYREAAAYAAVAQAEQLKRIGDAMERWLEVQGVLPEFYEFIDRERERRSQVDADSLGSF